MSRVILLLSGILFGVGLSWSGMTDSAKVKSFLEVGSPDWSAALLAVMGAAVLVYGIAWTALRRRHRTLDGRAFTAPAPGRVDRSLVVGSLIFGIGWGLAGVCPGPALAHIAYLDAGFAVFLVAMFAGFLLHRRTA